MIRLLLLLLLLPAFVGCAAMKASKVAPAPVPRSVERGPLRIWIIGLVHGHVEGLLVQPGKRPDLRIVGIYEPDRALFDRLAAKYGLDGALYFDNLGRMLDQTKPEAVSVMTSVQDHLMAVEACAPRGGQGTARPAIHD